MSHIDALLSAPVAAAFLTHAAEHRLGPAELADEGTATALATRVIGELSPWWPGAAERCSDAVRAAASLGALAEAVLSDERTSWWRQDVARHRQFWVTDSLVDPASFDVARTASIPWTVYAQHPVFDDCVVTSTELDVPAGDEVRSGLHSELTGLGLSDWTPEYPLKQARIRVAARARVYEIHSAADWHRLTTRYGDRDGYRGPDENLLTLGGIDHGIGPVWERLAAEWDGVHLSFLGLLTALYAPVTSDGATTTLWTWCCERTLWLRNVFDAVEPVQNLAERPTSSRE